MSKVPKAFTAIWAAPGGSVHRFSCRTREQLRGEINKLLVLEQGVINAGINELWRGRIVELTLNTLLIVPADFEVTSFEAGQ